MECEPFFFGESGLRGPVFGVKLALYGFLKAKNKPKTFICRQLLRSDPLSTTLFPLSFRNLNILFLKNILTT